VKRTDENLKESVQRTLANEIKSALMHGEVGTIVYWVDVHVHAADSAKERQYRRCAVHKTEDGMLSIAPIERFQRQHDKARSGLVLAHPIFVEVTPRSMLIEAEWRESVEQSETVYVTCLHPRTQEV
jgi:hypothetical protein